VENVVEVAKWLPYRAWRLALQDLGYCLHTVYLNSMFAQAGGDGAPQSRDRWYCLGHLTALRRCPDLRRWTRPQATCDRCGQTQRPIQAWKNPQRRWGRYGRHGQYLWACPTAACRGHLVHPVVLPAAVAIDWTLRGARIGDRAEPLAAKTIARIEAGLARYARPLMVPTGGTWRTDATPLDMPMPARTTRENDAVTVPPFLALLRSGRPRTVGIAEPFATIAADGSHHALVHPQPGRDTPADTAQAVLEFAAPPMVLALEGRATVTHVRPVDQPLRAQTGRHQDALIAPAPEHNDRPADGLLAWPQLLIPYYGTGTARPADQPMGTVSTRDRFAVLDAGVATSLDPLDCLFRMLEPAEIQAGMAFDAGYRILGTRRERVRQAGNAVTPPAAPGPDRRPGRGDLRPDPDVPHPAALRSDVMTAYSHERHTDPNDEDRGEDRHPDTAIVDAVAAFLNRDPEPSGADALELMSLLVEGSGRPLLPGTWQIDAQVTEDRYGIATATVTAGAYTIRIRQLADRSGDLRVDVVSADGDDYGLAVTVNGRRVLDPMPCTWTSSVPPDLQLTTEVRRH